MLFKNKFSSYKFFYYSTSFTGCCFTGCCFLYTFWTLSHGVIFYSLVVWIRFKGIVLFNQKGTALLNKIDNELYIFSFTPWLISRRNTGGQRPGHCPPHATCTPLTGRAGPLAYYYVSYSIIQLPILLNFT